MTWRFCSIKVCWQDWYEWALFQKPLCFYFADIRSKWGMWSSFHSFVVSVNLVSVHIDISISFYFLEHRATSARCLEPHWSSWEWTTLKEWGNWWPAEGNSGLSLRTFRVFFLRFLKINDHGTITNWCICFHDQAINKSLSCLSDVIFALAKKDDHVPFRNSKLALIGKLKLIFVGLVYSKKKNLKPNKK